MPFIESLVKHKSVSIIGMDKNCGKTVVLNYILDKLKQKDIKVALTSIGVDGEKRDIVTLTAKPEICIGKNTLFATAAGLYPERRLTSEIIELAGVDTPLGEVVIARALSDGRVLLGGPSSTPSLISVIDSLYRLGAELVLVDGALSRRSPGSPTATDATILCTGAAYSLNLDKLVRDTKHSVDMMRLPIFSSAEYEGKNIITLEGMLTDRMIEGYDMATKPIVVVKDFTRIFISAQSYRRFTALGGLLRVQKRSNLLAVCFNPYSPSGYWLNSEVAVAKLSSELGVEVYDVMSCCNG